MHLSLRRGERVYINGAVLRVDRKVSIELMNDATFLLENHIIHPEQAISPLKQLYLAIQTILMAPTKSDGAVLVCLGLISNFIVISEDKDLIKYLIDVRNNITSSRYYDALKILRNIFQDQSDRAKKWDELLGIGCK